MQDVAGKYLTLFLGIEEYGIEILKVQEIIAMMHITEVPRTADYVCGVVNLRGKIIRVIDLRKKLGLPIEEATRNTCIVFVEASSACVGVVVDRVSEVIDVVAEDVEPPPEFGSNVDTGFLRGLAKCGEKVRMLLDIDAVLATVDPGSDRSGGVAA